MKKFILILLVVLSFCLSACFLFEDKIISSVGKYTSKEVYTHGEFQDYADYGRYTYNDVDLSGNSYFEKISAESKTDLLKYVEHFNGLVEMFERNDPDDELVVNYDFDVSIISDEDYFLISDESKDFEFENYNIYYFDSETSTLYYFHNNY